MLINEASKITNLTKKAIEYYIEQNLVQPDTLDNGYRDFNEQDIECLKKISILRNLGLSTEEISKVLSDKSGARLKKLSVQKELITQREAAKNTILDKLSSGSSYDDISKELDAIEQSATVTEKLLNAFPGYYGRFICLHFANFLSVPIVTDEQKQAYREIIEFLDKSPSLNFPENLQNYLDEETKVISTEDINKMIEKTRDSINNPESFLSENKDLIEYYLTYMQTDEYKKSPPYQMKSLMHQFNKCSGYYDIFIPAMKKLSPLYAEYHKQSEIASEKLYERYPETINIDR